MSDKVVLPEVFKVFFSSSPRRCLLCATLVTIEALLDSNNQFSLQETLLTSYQMRILPRVPSTLVCERETSGVDGGAVFGPRLLVNTFTWPFDVFDRRKFCNEALNNICFDRKSPASASCSIPIFFMTPQKKPFKGEF